MKRSDDVLDLLAASDPQRDTVSDASDSARLATIRALVEVSPEQSTAPLAPMRSVWPRRLVVGGVAAGVLAAVPVVIPALLPDGANSPLSSLAIADDGRLNCGEGYATAIPPKDADLRLLPAELPPGWTLIKIFARDETSHGYCVDPSLTVADPQDGSRRLSVYGPFPPIDVEGLGSSTQVTLWGRPAARFDYDFKAPRELHRWVWTDETGQTWLAEMLGYTLAEGSDVLGSVKTETDHVLWEPLDSASHLSVLHRRTGPPYSTDSRGLSWYVDLVGPGGPVSLTVGKSYHNEPAPLLSRPSLAAGEVTQLNGRPLVVEAQETPDAPYFLLYEFAPGVHVGATTTRPPSDDLLRVIGSLTDVSADDPRLTELALDEDYG